jgi:hypothetical protein
MLNSNDKKTLETKRADADHLASVGVSHVRT